MNEICHRPHEILIAIVTGHAQHGHSPTVIGSAAAAGTSLSTNGPS
jgi:hypothetical protein